ncbi:hypothetical protein [Kistimonas scapharcae]
MSGCFSAAVIETDIGASNSCPFSPPPGWEGGREEYLVLMRHRLKTLDWGQRILCCARFASHSPIKIKGQFFLEANEILSALRM